MNRIKRKELAHVSVDSVKIGAVGDDTNGSINKIFSYIQNGALGEEKFFHSFRKAKLHERSNFRLTHLLHFKYGMTIGCSSTSGKGQLNSNDSSSIKPGTIAKMEIRPGSLQYEIGGISSYDSSKIKDHDNLILFFQFLRQCFSVLQVNELHISFDFLRNSKEIKVIPRNPLVQVKNYMNTTSYHYPAKMGLKVIHYDKSLKNQIYLPVSRLEAVLTKKCLKRFLYSIELDRNLNDEVLKKAIYSLASWVKSTIMQDFDVEGGDILIREEDICKQLLLIFKHIYGLSADSNNKYTKLTNLSREQINLWEASHKFQLLKIKLAADGYDLLNYEVSLNQIVKYLKCSKSTAFKIKKFIKNFRSLMMNDLQRDKLLAESKRIGAEIEMEISSRFATVKSLGELEAMTCTTLSQRKDVISSRLADVVAEAISSDLNIERTLVDEFQNRIQNSVRKVTSLRWKMSSKSKNEQHVL